MRFRSFRSRILFYLLGLVALIQGGVLLVVDVANSLNARRLIDQGLEVTARQFQARIETRSHELTVAARLLSGDFAFKQVFATGDTGTMRSALENQRRRIGADALVLISADGAGIMAHTLTKAGGASAEPFALLIDRAAEADEAEASGFVLLNGIPFRMVTVPLLAPLPVAWIVVGFQVDDPFADALKEDSLSEVSLLLSDGRGNWSDFASTLPFELRQLLPSALGIGQRPLDRSFTLELAGGDYVTLITELDRRDGSAFSAVLQRSRDEALAPFSRLRLTLFVLTVVALAVSLLLGHIIARSVSRPVHRLAATAEQIEKGDYSQRVETRQVDEMGQLAASFNRMAAGLKEREFIRETFGKYVPESVAAAILRDRSALAPESRMATVLFTDLQGFTSLCETMAPEQVVTLLNQYFSLLVGIIDRHGGVVNQFQGDAMLVTYNVPVSDPDHALSALRTALEIERVLEGHRFDGGRKLVTRVGINSGTVVAGSVGAGDRLSYTVHGDTVNLAARLEALNKEFATRILISESTRQLIGDDFDLEEIGEIPIRGRSSPVPVYSVPVAGAENTKRRAIPFP